MRCEMAAALKYIAGIDEPVVTWAEIMAGAQATPKQRGSALGGATHDVFEAWYTPGATPGWGGLPGQIALSGAGFLPHPARTMWHLAESAIGDTPIIYPAGYVVPDYAPRMGLVVDGVTWAGYRDLLAEPTVAEWRRLGLPGSAIGAGPYLKVDYKTTASIASWALDRDGLQTDLQAALYTIDDCRLLCVDRIASRWLYLETKEYRRALPVDVVHELGQSQDIVGAASERVKEFDLLTSVSDARKNPEACSDYGRPDKINCPYHRANGGPCDARRPVESLIRAHYQRNDYMPLSPEMQAKLDAAKAGIAAGGAAAPAKPAKPSPAKPVAPAKPAKPSPAKPKPAAAPEGDGSSVAEQISALAGELASAEAEFVAAVEAESTAAAKVEECKAAIKGLLA
jgi:hypothetical protein